MQLPEEAELTDVRAVRATCLEDGGEPLESRVREERPEPVADRAAPERRVPVAVRSEADLRVVHGETSQAIDPDALVQLVEGSVERVRIGDVDPRHPPVARVDADPEAGMTIEAGEGRSGSGAREADGATPAR